LKPKRGKDGSKNWWLSSKEIRQVSEELVEGFKPNHQFLEPMIEAAKRQ
jgi:hypothetical protein